MIDRRVHQYRMRDSTSHAVQRHDIRSISKIMAELWDVACFTMHPDGYSGTHSKCLDSTLDKCITLTELWMVCSELF